MDLTAEINHIVTRIEVLTGKNRSDISEELGYGQNYISTSLGRGGTLKLLEKLKIKYGHLLQPEKPAPATDQHEQALLKALLNDYIKLKSRITNQSVQDIAEEIDQNKTLILRDLMRDSDL